MKVSLALPVDRVSPPQEFLGHAAMTQMAQLAEGLGYDAVSVTDHPAPTGRWLDAGGHHAQDPFATLAFVAAATKRIQLQTGILVLSYRNPFLVARTVATMEALAPRRMLLGIGTGYLKGEYKALGANFDNRNDITDEYLRAYRTAMANDEFTFEGTGYVALGNRILPRPPVAPPLWIGGNSRRAIRRAAEFGDAWAPFHTAGSAQIDTTARTGRIDGIEDLREAIAYLKESAAAIDRAPPPDIVLDSMKSPTAQFDAAAWQDQIAAFADIGVTWIGVHMSGNSRAEWCANATRFAEAVLQPMRAR